MATDDLSLLADQTPLIDLTLLDLDAQALVDQAMLDAQSKLPDWVPREGNTEVVLIEAKALIVAELIYAVNRLPSAILDALLTLYGLTPDAGDAPAASVRFYTTAPGPVIVPSGTRVRVPFNGDTDSLDLLTDTDLLIEAGAGSGVCSATGEDPVAAANGVAAGVEVELVDAIAAIDRVVLTTAVAGGLDPEESSSYLARGANVFRRLVSTLVLPEHFIAAALEQPLVSRATAVDLYNPLAGSGVPGDHPGHMTVAVSGGAGQPLAPADAVALESALEAKAMAAIAVHVIAPTLTAVDFDVTITVVPGADPAAVQAAVAAALAAYVSPDTWPTAVTTIYRNEIISLVDRVDQVGRVVAVASPAGDVVLAGIAPLPSPGAITVHVS